MKGCKCDSCKDCKDCSCDCDMSCKECGCDCSCETSGDCCGHCSCGQ